MNYLKNRLWGISRVAVILGAISICGILIISNSLALAETVKVNEDIFKDISNELRCPTCQGLSVIDSEAAFSVQIKEEVKRQMAEGKDKKTILDFFSDRYGPWILRSPPKEGVHAIVWLIPILILSIGPLLIWRFVIKRKTVELAGKVRPMEEIVAEMKSEIETFKSRGKG